MIRPLLSGGSFEFEFEFEFAFESALVFAFVIELESLPSAILLLAVYYTTILSPHKEE